MFRTEMRSFTSVRHVLVAACTAALAATLLVAAPPSVSAASWKPQMGSVKNPVAYPNCRPIRVRFDYTGLQYSGIKGSRYKKILKRKIRKIANVSGYNIRLVGKTDVRFYSGPYSSGVYDASPGQKAAELTMFFTHPSAPRGKKPYFSGAFQYQYFTTIRNNSHPKSFLGESTVAFNAAALENSRRISGNKYLHYIFTRGLLLALGLDYNGSSGSVLSSSGYLITSPGSADAAGLRALYRGGSCTPDAPPPAL